ncbi:MAG: hypothetical protein GWN00_17580, partial [Aliifodinibius sp.]|nr:hypothetical protein [Fodinibius sp.]NIV12826.1 hypothetical protein [Fodinibius sp.]NIY26548.1 hypothetical protein [Fodinibius sp.]
DLVATNLLAVGDVVELTSASTSFLIDDDECFGFNQGNTDYQEENIQA